MQRLAEEGIDGGFGDRLEPLDLTRRLQVEALEEEEEEEEDRDDDEDEGRDDGDGEAGTDDEHNHRQNVFYQIRNHIVRHLDVLGEPGRNGESGQRICVEIVRISVQKASWPDLTGPDLT